MQYVDPANVSIFDARVYAQPIMAQQQAQMQNALAGGMGARPQVQDALRDRVQYNALAQGGGPTKPAAANLGAYDAGNIASKIRHGLISRGLPDHVADAFVMNMKDESNLNPGINEISPLVPGSRGGFGLYQLTGPRRVAYEAFARDRGVPLDDVDAQLDFLVTELEGPESRAARNILSSGDTGTAAAAIVRDFLRPAPEHLRKRVARYTETSAIAEDDLTRLGL